MAMPQRDDTIEAIKRLDALLEYAVMHGDEEEAERIREELRKFYLVSQKIQTSGFFRKRITRAGSISCFTTSCSSALSS